jgi:flagellar hook-associated protein 2
VNVAAAGVKDFQTAKVKIDQVASGQINKSSALSSKSIFGSGGFKEFEIRSLTGKTERFSFYAGAGDSNNTVLSKMADVINKAKGGYTATVTRDEQSGKSFLSIGARNIGDSDANRFTVADINGDAVSRTGVATVAEDAKDAVYSVNGGEKITAASNNVDLGGGVSAVIRAASDEPVTVTAGFDNAESVGKAGKLVAGINDLLSAVYDNIGKGSERLFDDIVGAVKSYAPALGRIGVSMGSDGFLKIDENALDKAAESGELDSFFTKTSSSNYGFISRISKVAGNIETNPAYYSNTGAGALYNTGYFDYQSYNQYAGIGLMLDAFI